MDIKENQERFIKIYKQNIKREGSDKLLEYLLSTDFFTAPASTRFHLSEEGGLCLHSLHTYERLLADVKNEYGRNWEETFPAESITICGLLHDVCKANMYKVDTRNVKNNGVWEQVPYYTVEDKLPYGHGEKSVYIINGFMRITRDEAMAINWHMGPFDARVSGGGQNIMKEAFYQFPLALMTFFADMQAVYLDEKEKTEE